MKEFAKKRFFLFGKNFYSVIFPVKVYARTNRCGAEYYNVIFPVKFYARTNLRGAEYYNVILTVKFCARTNRRSAEYYSVIFSIKVYARINLCSAEYYSVIFFIKFYARTNRCGRMLFYKTWRIIPLFQPFRAQGNRSLPLQTKFSSTDRACSRGAASNCLPEWTGRRNRRKYFYDT